MRTGELERYAVEWACQTAWWLQLWNPADPDFGYVDYFEAHVTRNLRIIDDFASLDLDDPQIRRELRRSEAKQSEQATLLETIA